MSENEAQLSVDRSGLGAVADPRISRSPIPLPNRRRGRHPLAGFLARRLAQGLLVMFAASVVIFIATNVLPGNVASVILGKNATPQTLHIIDSRLGLNKPVLDRYGSWLVGVLHGDLGLSAVAVIQGAAQTSVGAIVSKPLLNTTILATITMIILLPLSLLLGTIAGVHAGRGRDYAISYTALVIGAFPEFVFGTFLIFVFFSKLHLLPPVALVAPGASPLSRPNALVLPVLTLLGVALAFSARQVRAGVAEIMRRDYVRMARLNGIPESRVVWRYALRNALAPSVQTFAQTAQYLVGGIVVVEAVFSYPGIGTILVNAAEERDLPVVAAVGVILAAIYITINIVADLIVVFLVPKLRTGFGM